MSNYIIRSRNKCQAAGRRGEGDHPVARRETGVLKDALRGDYRVPWKAVAALAAAAAYVVSPIDLIPDFLGPLGFTDDLLVVAVTWGLVRRELLSYCAWKGLSPAHFGLEQPP